MPSGGEGADGESGLEEGVVAAASSAPGREPDEVALRLGHAPALLDEGRHSSSRRIGDAGDALHQLVLGVDRGERGDLARWAVTESGIAAERAASRIAARARRRSRPADAASPYALEKVRRTTRFG